MKTILTLLLISFSLTTWAQYAKIKASEKCHASIEYAAQIIEDQKESLKELAELRLSGKITDDQLKSELEDVIETVNNQGLALWIISDKHFKILKPKKK